MQGLRVRRTAIGTVSGLIVGCCCLAALAAEQFTSRLEPHGTLGITLQSVDWALPDPGFDWEPVTDVDLDYTWDWVPTNEWTETGNPPVSIARKYHAVDVYDAYDEISYVDTYAVTAIGQTYYSGSIELNVVIQDANTGALYHCYAYSSDGTDAYNNYMEHVISSTDWIIYQL